MSVLPPSMRMISKSPVRLLRWLMNGFMYFCSLRMGVMIDIMGIFRSSLRVYSLFFLCMRNSHICKFYKQVGNDGET